MMDSYDQAAYHAEQLQVQHDIEDVILKAMRETLTADDARLLAWASGINLTQLNTNRKEMT